MIPVAWDGGADMSFLVLVFAPEITPNTSHCSEQNCAVLMPHTVSDSFLYLTDHSCYGLFFKRIIKLLLLYVDTF